MKNLLNFVFVVLFAYLLTTSGAHAQYTDVNVVESQMDDSVCLPLENDADVFECMTPDNKWVFCAMDDDLQLYCIN